MNAATFLEFALGAAGYVGASTLYIRDLYRRDSRADAEVGWARRLLVAAALCHAAHLVTVSLLGWFCPLFTVRYALSLAALVAVFVFLLLGRQGRLRALGAVVGPWALTFLVGSEFVAAEQPLGHNRPLLAVHVTSNVLGLALFVLAGAVASLYLVHERRLKARRLGGPTSKLPPLDALDRAGHGLLLGGFPLLSIGIVTGAMFSAQLQSAVGGPALARALLACATWLVAAAVLVLREVAGWRGRRGAMGTVVGAVLMLLVIAVYIAQPRFGDAQ